MGRPLCRHAAGRVCCSTRRCEPWSLPPHVPPLAPGEALAPPPRLWTRLASAVSCATPLLSIHSTLTKPPVQVADQGPEVWQYVHCRRAGPARYLRRSLAPTSGGEQREPGRRPPTLQELARLLSRQRAHLRRLTVEENAGDWENAAQAVAVVLTAATTVGSGLTDLTLVVAEQLSDHVMEVRGSCP